MIMIMNLDKNLYGQKHNAQGITEFTDQLPLIAGFASAYAEVNAEQTQKVVQTFSRSLSCNLECDDMTDLQVHL